MDQFHTILKELVGQKGKNQSEVAGKLGISSQLLGQYIKDRQKPKMDFFIKWKNTFGEDLAEIYETNVSRGTNEASNDQMIYTIPTLTENGARLKDHKNENSRISNLEERMKVIERETKENGKILMQLQALMLQKM